MTLRLAGSETLRMTALVAALFCFWGHSASGEPKLHALTLADAPKYKAGFSHLDYANPDAPKGGAVTFSVIGTFDSFNPYIIKGSPAALPGLIETLTTSPDDDTLSEYGLIAESMEVAPDKSWIIFNLRPEARWHDGVPITPDDVIFSFSILKEKGDPFYRYYYKDVSKAEKIGASSVKFTFTVNNNRELPVIMGQLPILPKHFWEKREFSDVLIEAPLGSGPYRLSRFDLGRSYVMERIPNYWGKDLPIKKGIDNYDTVTIDYFRDPTVALEAFKAGAIDFRQENRAKDWATAYDIPAVREGRIRKELIPHANPAGLQGFLFNLRHPIFADSKVRQALNLAFDFEWSNKTLFFGQYKRSRSYFENSAMAATGLPSPEELLLLNPLRDMIPPEVFTSEYHPPETDGSGNARANLEMAADLLDEAGWKVENGTRKKDGKEFVFEILLDDPAFERIAEPYARNLKKIGITASLRRVDDAQYQKRWENFDFDMIVKTIGQSLSPGNEQRELWSSTAADMQGSNNLIGIKNPAIDRLVDLVVAAPSRADLIIRCRALDRVLQWNYYTIPQWNLSAFRIAYWDKFGQPEKRPDPLYGLGASAWWVDPAKLSALSGVKNPAAAEISSEMQTTTTTSPEEKGGSGSPLLYGLAGLLAILFFIFLRRRNTSGKK